MTTHQLAKKLLELPDIRVVVDGYEGGLEDVTESSIHPVIIHVNEHKMSDLTCFGSHGDCSRSRWPESECWNIDRYVHENAIHIER